MRCHAQLVCDDGRTVVATLSGGADRNGPVMHAEAGLWKVDRSLSFYGGLSVTNGDAQPKTTRRAEVRDMYVRSSLKIGDWGDDFGTAITALASVRGDFGASVRLCWRIGPYSLVGIEPAVSYKHGQSVSFFVTCGF